MCEFMKKNVNGKRHLEMYLVSGQLNTLECVAYD